MGKVFSLSPANINLIGKQRLFLGPVFSPKVSFSRDVTEALELPSLWSLLLNRLIWASLMFPDLHVLKPHAQLAQMGACGDLVHSAGMPKQKRDVSKTP